VATPRPRSAGAAVSVPRPRLSVMRDADRHLRGGLSLERSNGANAATWAAGLCTIAAWNPGYDVSGSGSGNTCSACRRVRAALRRRPYRGLTRR
jgi:hypothetical protein